MKSIYPQSPWWRTKLTGKSVFSSGTSVYSILWKFVFGIDILSPAIGITKISFGRKTRNCHLCRSRNFQRCCSMLARCYNSGVTTMKKRSRLLCSIRRVFLFAGQSCWMMLWIKFVIYHYSSSLYDNWLEVCACKGLESFVKLGFSERQDQRNGTSGIMCYSRGILVSFVSYTKYFFDIYVRCWKRPDII